MPERVYITSHERSRENVISWPSQGFTSYWRNAVRKLQRGEIQGAENLRRRKEIKNQNNSKSRITNAGINI
ncbi:MAG: hypothetical protein KAR33_14350 [Candidatus Thorarchaeota archaeon]|nr:hypothetical protein [Candidatus Thorarchaeota archaeon]